MRNITSIPEKTRPEEWANGLTHGIGLALSIAGLILLTVLASRHGTAWHVVSCVIYGSALVLLFNFSMLYHLVRPSRAKRIFRLLDHSSIFLLIAGTYTPFVLVTLRGLWGWVLFSLVWGLCLFGIAGEAVWRQGFRRFSLPIYLVMGWLAVLVIRPLWQMLPGAAFGWLIGGGIAYTVGVIFYAMKRTPYAHTVWHLFVLAGSAFHWVCIVFYVIPRG